MNYRLAAITAALCALSIVIGCVDDDVTVATIHQIEGTNQLCVYPEPLTDAVAHENRFVPFDPAEADSAVVIKGKDRWMGSGNVFRPGSPFVRFDFRADWRDGASFNYSHDILGFLVAPDIAPGCYPLSDSEEAWAFDSVSVGFLSTDVDIILSMYRLDPSAENYFEVLAPLDNIGSKLRARFKMTLLADTPNPPYIHAITRFSNGYLESSY